MNKPVDFSTAKLLKEKGWNKETLCHYFEDGVFRQNELRDTVGMDYGSDYIVEFSELINNWNDSFLMKKNGDRCFGCNKNKGYFETFSAPTITEICMWLYEKYGIWVEVYIDDNNTFGYLISKITKEGRVDSPLKRYFNSPIEAYLAAIEYTLKNLI